jgi:hypothetical protein
VLEHALAVLTNGRRSRANFARFSGAGPAARFRASLGELLAQGKNNLQAPWLGLTAFFVIALMLSLLIFPSVKRSAMPSIRARRSNEKRQYAKIRRKPSRNQKPVGGFFSARES